VRTGRERQAEGSQCGRGSGAVHEVYTITRIATCLRRSKAAAVQSGPQPATTAQGISRQARLKRVLQTDTQYRIPFQLVEAILDFVGLALKGLRVRRIDGGAQHGG
jgi:hypothetical protein